MEYQDLRDWIEIADEMGAKDPQGLRLEPRNWRRHRVGGPQRRWSGRFV